MDLLAAAVAFERISLLARVAYVVSEDEQDCQVALYWINELAAIGRYSIRDDEKKPPVSGGMDSGGRVA